MTDELPPIDKHLLVLVVEDEFVLALDIEMTLLGHGHRILGPAATVQEALALLVSDRPDVALLDFHLRGETVTVVAQKLTELGVPMVLATATDARALSQIPALGAARNIGKPFEPSAMIKALGAAVSQ